MKTSDILSMSQAELHELVNSAGQPVRKVELQGRWIPSHHEEGKWVQGQYKVATAAAGLSDIANVTATVVLEEVLGLVGPEYALRNICRVVGMSQLIGTIRTATKAAAQTDVPAGEEAPWSKIAYNKVDFNLRDKKDVYHMAVLDEDRKQANTDVLRDATQDAAVGLASAENTKIKTVIEAATALTGADWASANPYEDLGAAMAAIEAASGLAPDRIAAHPLVWADFFGSSFVKNAIAGLQWPSAKVFPLPGWQAITGIMDNSMTNTVAVVAASRGAFGLGDGPTEAEQYRIPAAGADVYIIRHWNEPKSLLAGASRKLTGVHA